MSRWNLSPSCGCHVRLVLIKIVEVKAYQRVNKNLYLHRSIIFGGKIIFKIVSIFDWSHQTGIRERSVYVHLYDSHSAKKYFTSTFPLKWALSTFDAIFRLSIFKSIPRHTLTPMPRHTHRYAHPPFSLRSIRGKTNLNSF